jgi:D-alanyl-D-alanine carboxypeptidase (penicillin-binding protein 5/6)
VAETDGSSLYMTPGERISARDLLYALLLRSANDACVAVAKAVSGSDAAFADLMNRAARQMGATGTHFANSHGLPHALHYTTARDLAKMACHAVRLPVFNEVVATRFRRIARLQGKEPRMLRNHAKFLWYYAGADGIKTGYTVAAGRCFVGSATRDGWRLISVVLNSPDMYGETARLLDYGFSTFEPLTIIEPGRPMGTVAVDGGSEGVVGAAARLGVRTVARRSVPPDVTVRRSVRRISAPVRRGAAIGEATAYANGVAVGSVQLIAVRDVPVLPPARVAGRLAWRVAVSMLAVMVFWHVSARPKGTGRRRDRIETGLRDLDTFRSRNR